MYSMYDSPSDSSVEDSLDELVLHGDFNEVDRLLQDGASLDILESPRWDYFVKDFLRLENWRSKIRNIQLLYIHQCVRQLDTSDKSAVYLMELKCNIKSWVFIATMDEELFVQRLEPYLDRFDSLAMDLYENILALCHTQPTHEIRIPTCETAIGLSAISQAVAYSNI